MMTKIQLVLFLTAVLTLPTRAADCDGMAHTLLLHGNVLTVDQNDTVAEAIAIRHNRIVAVGSDRKVERYRYPDSRIIDLEGRTVIPGLTNAHIHAIRGGQSYRFETHWNDVATLGSLEVGKLADLAVLDADLMRAPVDEIGKIRSVLTIMDGKIVHTGAPYVSLAP